VVSEVIRLVLAPQFCPRCYWRECDRRCRRVELGMSNNVMLPETGEGIAAVPSQIRFAESKRAHSLLRLVTHTPEDWKRNLSPFFAPPPFFTFRAALCQFYWRFDGAEFERDFARFCDSKILIGVGSGTDAIALPCSLRYPARRTL